MASRFRTFNSAAEGGEPVIQTDRGPVPLDVTTSRDFAVRCDRDPRLWKLPARLPPGYSINQMIDQRVHYSDYTVKLDGRLDVLYARYRREVTYCKRLADMVDDPGVLYTAEFFDAQLLLASRSLIWPQGVPDDDEYDFYMPFAWRKWERTGRSRYGVFVAVQHREAMGMRPGVLRGKYPRLPEGWERYEVPYGLHPQAPPVVTYYGLDMAWKPTSAVQYSLFWKVLYTEHAWTTVAELMHEARRGVLWWIPFDLISGIEQIGLESICFGFPGHVDELRTLLYEIKVIRWDKVPRRNGPVPRVNFNLTPVYNSGDYVDFDTVNWCTQLRDDMYVALDAYGEPLEGMVGRGALQEGELLHNVAEPVADANIYSTESDDNNEEGGAAADEVNPGAEAGDEHTETPMADDGPIEEIDIREMRLQSVQRTTVESGIPEVNTNEQSCGLRAEALRTTEQQQQRLMGEAHMVTVDTNRATVVTSPEGRARKRVRRTEQQSGETSSSSRRLSIAPVASTTQVKEESQVIDVDLLFPSPPGSDNA